MNEEEQLDYAISTAATHHYGQVDKAGQPYILHCLHVMNCFDDLEYKAVAVLHDCVDAGVTLEKGFSKPLVTAVDLFRRRSYESYDGFISRLAKSKNSMAIRVKIEVLKHNMQASRFTSCFYPKELFTEMLPKYHDSYVRLCTVLQNII